MSVDEVLQEIRARLHFVPPFFSPALDNPPVLENLWQQTKSAYLDNPLPALFKEKLAALLGRRCEVPYCLMCHTCTLRPLGMGGNAVVELLSRQLSGAAQVFAALDRFESTTEQIDFPVASESTEQDLFVLVDAVYASGPTATRARAALRRRLRSSDYDHLLVFATYNKMCHEWMAAHPEISYELDQRYTQNYAALVAEAPQLEAVVGGLGGPSPNETDRAGLAAVPAAEIARSVEISERRLFDVLHGLKASVASAADQAMRSETLAGELRRGSDFVQQLLAIVSHDLRNPLNVIVMGAHRISTLCPEDARITKHTQRMTSAAMRADRLIHDLLDFSLARAGGGIPVRLDTADLHETVRRYVSELEVAHSDTRFELTHDGSTIGSFDDDRITQVLSNLIGNAIAHGQGGEAIEIATRTEGADLVLEVANVNREGPIPKEVEAVLFDPFKRGAQQGVSRTRSIGLGLFIVAEIAKAHGGTVGVVSTEERTTFTFRMPRSR